MVRLTKAQQKDRDRIDAWLNATPFKENSRAKPEIPALDRDQVLDTFVPLYISDGAKFYTPRQMAYQLYNLQPYLVVPRARILEPCAGIGNLLVPLLPHLEPVTDASPMVDCYELDQEAYQIGAKLFPTTNWNHANPYDRIKEIEGKYDIVIMNPPYNITWATYIEPDTLVSGATKSHHMFLEVALRALKAGGTALIIAPWNYFDTLPKKIASWFHERIDGDPLDFGQLSGEFRFTKVSVHGWIIERNDFDVPVPSYTELEADDNLPGLPVELDNISGDDKEQDEILESMAVDQGKQLELVDLFPDVVGPAEREELPVKKIFELLDEKSKAFTRKPGTELLNSIKKFGVRYPIILVSYQNGSNVPRFRLRAGSRRLQAARQLGISTIPVLVYPESAMGGISGALLTIDDNVTRSSNPLMEVQAIQEIIDGAAELGVAVTPKEIATVTGMPLGTVKKRLRLQRLSRPVLDAVLDGKVAVTTAETLAKQPLDVREKIGNQLASGEKVTENTIKEVKTVISDNYVQSLMSAIETHRPVVHALVVVDYDSEDNPLVTVLHSDYDKDRLVKKLHDGTLDNPSTETVQLLTFEIGV